MSDAETVTIQQLPPSAPDPLDSLSISPSIVVMTREELRALMERFSAIKQPGRLELIPCYEPRPYDVVVRAHPPNDQPDGCRGFEVITPFDGKTTQDQLDVGEMLRCLLQLTGVMTVNPMQMLTQDEWAEQRARWSANGANAKAEARARIAELYTAMIRELLDTFEAPDIALTQEQHEVCARARSLLITDPEAPGGAGGALAF